MDQLKQLEQLDKTMPAEAARNVLADKLQSRVESGLFRREAIEAKLRRIQELEAQSVVAKYMSLMNVPSLAERIKRLCDATVAAGGQVEAMIVAPGLWPALVGYAGDPRGAFKYLNIGSYQLQIYVSEWCPTDQIYIGDAELSNLAALEAFEAK